MVLWCSVVGLLTTVLTPYKIFLPACNTLTTAAPHCTYTSLTVHPGGRVVNYVEIQRTGWWKMTFS